MDKLTVGLTESGRYTVLSNRQEFAAVLGEEAEFQNLGYLDDNQLLTLGKAMGADFACYVKIRVVEGDYSVNCEFVGLKQKQGMVTKAFDVRVNSSQGLSSGLINAATQMAKQIASGRDFTQAEATKWVTAPKCCYNDNNGQYVDCIISRKDEEAMTYADAVAFCKSKGEGWYLPTKEELSLIYRNQISIVENGGVKFSRRDYWSSSKRNNYESFVINFSTGQAQYYSINIKNVFRCVQLLQYD